MLGRSEFALRRGFAFGKTLERRKSGAAQKGRWARCRKPIENLKYLDCSDLTKKKHLQCRCFFFGYLGPFKLLGRNKFALRRGFACGKRLVRRKSAAAQKGRWARCRKPIENLKYLDCSDLTKKKHLQCRCFFFGYLGPFKLLGRNKFALRRGFACGKRLVRRKSAAAQKGC